MMKRKNKTFGRLVVIKDDNSEGSIYPLKKDICVMGRDFNCDVIFDNPIVSRHHCEITYDGNNLPKLIQRSKLNSLLVNGNRIYKDYVLHHNDIITIGVKKLRFELLFNPKITETDLEKESNLENDSNILASEKPHLSTFLSNNSSNCNNIEGNKENEKINISKSFSFSQTLPTQSIFHEKFYQKEEEKEKESSIIENVSFLSQKNADHMVDLVKNRDHSIQETSKGLSSNQTLTHNEASLPNINSDCRLVNIKNKDDNKKKETSLLNEELTDDKEKDKLSIQNSVNIFVQNQTSDDEKNKYTDKIMDSSQNQWFINDENTLAKKPLEGSFIEQNNDDIEKHESQHEMLAFREENLSIKLANCSFTENPIQICNNLHHNTTKEDNDVTKSCNEIDAQTNVFSFIEEHGSYARECLKTPVDEFQDYNKDKVEESVITNTNIIDKLGFPFKTDTSIDKSPEVPCENKTADITDISNISVKTTHTDINEIIITERKENISISDNLDNLKIENDEGDLVKENESENLEKTKKNETKVEDEESANKASINDYNQKLVQNTDKNSDKIMKSEECEERQNKIIITLRSTKKKKEIAKNIVNEEESNEAKKKLGTKGAKSVKVEAQLGVSKCEDEDEIEDENENEDENEAATVRKSRRARKPPKRFEISW